MFDKYVSCLACVCVCVCLPGWCFVSILCAACIRIIGRCCWWWCRWHGYGWCYRCSGGCCGCRRTTTRCHWRDDSRFIGRFSRFITMMRCSDCAGKQCKLATPCIGRFECGEHFLLLHRSSIYMMWIVQLPWLHARACGHFYTISRLIVGILNGRQRWQYYNWRRTSFDFD